MCPVEWLAASLTSTCQIPLAHGLVVIVPKKHLQMLPKSPWRAEWSLAENQCLQLSSKIACPGDPKGPKEGLIGMPYIPFTRQFAVIHSPLKEGWIISSSIQMRVRSVEGCGPGCLATVQRYHSLLYPEGKAESTQPTRLRMFVLVVVASAIRQEKEVSHKLLKERKPGWEVTSSYLFM